MFGLGQAKRFRALEATARVMGPSYGERLKKGTGASLALANIRHAVPLKRLVDRAPSPDAHMRVRGLSVNLKA
jgi:hypothetical protein